MSFISTILPHGSMRRTKLKKGLIKLRLLDPAILHGEYNNWLEGQRAAINFDESKLTHKPLITIVVPCFNTPEDYLRPLVYSVTNQLYENWELILVDASTDTSVSGRIEEYLKVDNRIRVFRTPNKGISANTNKGIVLAKGEYVGFLDHDDTLEENALAEVALVINKDPEVDVIYSDEDKLSENGEYALDPHFKPDFSPDLLGNLNYITHFVVARSKLVKRIGRLNPDRDGAQDYDLMLRLYDAGARFHHVPKVLYHWRLAKASTAKDFAVKDYVLNAGVKALQDHLKRNHIEGKVAAIENRPGFYRIMYGIHKDTKISFIVLRSPTANIPNVLIDRIRRRFMHAHIITNRLKQSEEDDDNLTYLEANSGSDLVNKAESVNKSDVSVVVLNTALPRANDIEDLIGAALQKDIFAVAPLAVNEKNRIVDAGLVQSANGVQQLFAGCKLGTHTIFGDTEWVRNVNALSGNIFAIKTRYLKENFKRSPSWFTDNAKNNNLRNTIWSHCVWEHLGNIEVEDTGGLYSPNVVSTETKIDLNSWAGDRDV